MAGSRRAMRRHREGGIGAPLGGCGGIEQQNGARTAMEEDVTAGLLGYPLEAEEVAIKALGRLKVLGVEDALENLGGRRHGHATARSCRATSSAIPLRANRRSSKKLSSENGAPSAVPWISTMPPSPVRTKFASVPAPLSSW